MSSSGFNDMVVRRQLAAEGLTPPDAGIGIITDDAKSPFAGLKTSLGFDNGNIFGMNSDQIGGLSTLGGLAMRAFAMPAQMDMYKAKTGLLNQQLASNNKAMADRNKFNSTWANASNGLAHPSTQVA